MDPSFYFSKINWQRKWKENDDEINKMKEIVKRTRENGLNKLDITRCQSLLEILTDGFSDRTEWCYGLIYVIFDKQQEMAKSDLVQFVILMSKLK